MIASSVIIKWPSTGELAPPVVYLTETTPNTNKSVCLPVTPLLTLVSADFFDSDLKSALN